jgi:uncharacterized protein (TIGR03118 family)
MKSGISMSKTTIGVVLSFLATVSIAGAAGEFQVTNLVSDQPGVAQLTDPSLVNAWGISASATSPFWISDNGTGKSTLYSINAGTVTKIGLTVSIPGDGSVTGQFFNPTAGSGDFNHDNFVFVSEDGTVSGWKGALGTSAEVLQAGSSSNIYKGVAYGTPSGGSASYAYAANFGTGAIDVIKGQSGDPSLTGSFIDPNVPTGYAPFNISNIGGILYVAYAETSGGTDEVDGPGLGYVSTFDLEGNLLTSGLVGAGGPLNAPWGFALAPSGFDSVGGDLLIGNFGDGAINAFSLTGVFQGALADTTGTPLSLDGLWGLKFGNGGSGGDPEVLYFTAGPDGEDHGLFGSLTAVPEPSTLLLLAGSLPALVLLRRRNRRGR